MSNNKQSMFVLPDGRNVFFTFCLVSSLFLLWGFCNGMIDVMDKHFQSELHLTLAQSAWMVVAFLVPVVSGVALAVSPGKTLEFKNSSMGTVKFDGELHKKAGATCKALITYRP